jgi:aminocarboxymuconate-semialdehyde decarboxylase
MATYDLPIWLHPFRGADFSDYATEDRSQYEIWWTFGWPYDTSAAMARLVFAGHFDRFPQLKIITHHMGAMALLEGRSADDRWAHGPPTATTARCCARLRSGSSISRCSTRHGALRVMPARCGPSWRPRDLASDAPFRREGPMYIRETTGSSAADF